jgi:hypothetical protein
MIQMTVAIGPTQISRTGQLQLSHRRDTKLHTLQLHPTAMRSDIGAWLYRHSAHLTKPCFAFRLASLVDLGECFPPSKQIELTEVYSTLSSSARRGLLVLLDALDAANSNWLMRDKDKLVGRLVVMPQPESSPLVYIQFTRDGVVSEPMADMAATA